MSYTPPLEAEETGFKTTTPILAGLTFNSTGSWDGAVDGYSQVQTEIVADQDGTIAINFCSDAGFTDVVRSLSIPYVAANGYQFFAAPAFANFIEYKFTNTTVTDQTDFYYTTKILTTAIAPQLLTTEAFIASSMVTELGRSITVGIDPTGTFTNAKIDGSAFLTTANLASGSTYDSGVLDVRGYTQVQTHVNADQDGTLVIYFSSDDAGANVARTLTVPFSSGSGFQLYSAPAFTPYIKYTFVNGAIAQGDFYYETKLLTTSLSAQVLTLDAFIAPSMTANLGRNIIAGVEGSTFQNVNVAETTNDSGTYHNLHVVSGARPSQLPGRVAVKIVLDDTADALKHTTTAGKTLFITDMSLILDNSDQNNQGRFEIQNSTTAAGTLVYAVLAPESANNQSAATTIGQTFTEPLEFGTGVFVEEISGTCTLTGVLNGYEE
tara:strand:- start:457 stop:1767 length:1311 start_codon:yes stop_codon:yes gene_type:complete